MANTGFGARELTLLSGGTPTISVPAQLDIKATTVGISTGLTVGAAATFSSTLNVTDIATFTRINANEVNSELYFNESDDSNKTCNIPFMNAAQSGNSFAWLEVDHSVLTFNPNTNILTTNGLLATGNVTAQGNYLGDGASLTGIVTTLVAGNGINISDTTGQITITNSSVGIGSDVSINTTGIISAFAFDSSGTGDPVIRVGSGTTLNLEAPIVAISTDLTVGGTSTLAILESPRPNLPEIYAGAGSTITLSATQVAITTNCAIGGDVTVTNIGLSGNLNGSDGTININSNVLNFYNNASANKLLEINHTSGFVAVSTNFSAPQYETSSTTYGNGTDRGYSITYNITANGSSSYSFAGPGIVNTRTNPAIYLQRGFTYNLVNTTGGHPFRIQYAGTTTGYGSTYLSGSQTGTQTFTVPFDAPSTLEYECSSHASMKGDIIIPA